MTLLRPLFVVLTLVSLCAPSGAITEAEAKSKAKAAAAKKKKGYDYDRSKYKSRDLATEDTHSYKFNDKGDPILPKKKGGKDKKKKAEPPEVAADPKACGLEESCAPAKSSPDAEAEAL